MEFDDVLSQMLGELDDITQQLEAVPVAKKPETTHVPRPPSNLSKAATTPPPPPPKKLSTNHDDINLSAMLDDLCTFEDKLSATTDGIPNLSTSISTSQDSGIGFRSDSLPRGTNSLYVDDGEPKFNTLKRAGQGEKSFASAAFSNYNNDDDFDDDLSLDALSKDIDQDHSKQPSFSQEDLASLSPMLHELDGIVNSLSACTTDPLLLHTAGNGPTYGNKTPQINTLNKTLDNKTTAPVPPPVSQKPKPALKPHVPAKPTSSTLQSERERSVSEVTKTTSFPTKHSGSLKIPFKPSTESPEHPETSSDHPKLSEASEILSESPKTIPDPKTSSRPSERRKVSFSGSQEFLGAQEDDVASNTSSQTHDTNQSSEDTKSIQSITTTSSSDLDSDTSSVAAANLVSVDQDNSANSDIKRLEERLNILENVNKSEMSAEEREERMKSEKMRIALEKLKEARIQKFVVKVYNKDDSAKTLVIDERMTARTTMKQLLEKNHFDQSPNWALIEELPSMQMDRMFEEHEKPCEIMSHWTRDTTNQLRFVERKDKYALFKNPQHYLLTQSESQEQMHERQKQTLIEEFFSGKGPSSGVPEVEGFLHVKNEGKSWTRKYCLLRSSGLYASKTGEPKKGKKVSDLVCLIMFEQSLLYLGRGWKKRFKSPFDYGFALKRPEFQVKSKHIKYLCCEDFKSLMKWTVGIRLAKYGKQLLLNYEKTNEDIKSHSVLSSHFAFRQQQIDSAAAAKASDPNSTKSLPRGMGMKNIFGGAWKRAEEDQPINVPSPGPAAESSPVHNVTRAKSVWKPANKKASNWWDLQDEDNAPDTQPQEEPQRRNSDVRTSVSYTPPVSAAPPPPPPTLMKPTYQPPPVETLPPPPPMDDLPPPPPMDSSYYPPASDMPPPPPMGDSATFMSYGDLPPPPPIMTGGPPPPPKPGKKPPPPVPQKYNFSNNNNSPPQSRDSLEEEPPFFQPPPPKSTPIIPPKIPQPYKPTSNMPPPAKSTPNIPPLKPSPLTCYYSNLTYTADDFPPPPPFVMDLKESFAVANRGSEGSPHQHTAPPKSVLSHIKSKSGFRSLLPGSGKKAPPPPRRNAGTRLSTKR